jgi:hypothetical protein
MTPQPHAETPTPRTDAEWNYYVQMGMHDSGERFARTLERELIEARHGLDELSKAAMVGNSEIAHLKAAIEMLNGDKEELANRLAARTQEVEKLTRERDANSHQSSANAQSSDNWRQEAAQLQVDLAQLRAALAEAKRDGEHAAKELADLKDCYFQKDKEGLLELMRRNGGKRRVMVSPTTGMETPYIEWPDGLITCPIPDAARNSQWEGRTS